MKSIAIALWLIILSVSALSSQIRFDVVGGISPGSKPSGAGLVVNRHLPHEEFVFNIDRMDPQMFAGFKGHLELGTPFFVDAGLLYSMKRSTFDVVYTIMDTEHPVAQARFKHTEHILMLPVNIGANIGLLDVTSGLRLERNIMQTSDLGELTGFRKDKGSVNLGWQAGIGVDIFRSRIGLEYQGNFSRVGKGMYVNDQPLELTYVPVQLVLLLQHSF